MFFLVAKLLDTFAEPLNLFVLMFALSVFAYWIGWQKIARRAGIVLAVLFVLCSYTQLPDFLLSQLEPVLDESVLTSEKDNIAGIIVLGGAISTDKQQKTDWYHINDAAERITESIFLAKKLPETRLVYTGGNGALIGHGGIDADGFERLLKRLGGLTNPLVLERNSKNTWQNAQFTAELLMRGSKRLPQGKWILVTSAFHMKRASAAFSKTGFDIIEWPTDFRADVLRFPWITTASTRQLLKLDIFVHEIVGLAAYRFSGRN